MKIVHKRMSWLTGPFDLTLNGLNLARSQGEYAITVPLKGKLTVTRELRNSTRDSILDPRKFRESSLESIFATRELDLSSFESRKIMSLLLD